MRMRRVIVQHRVAPMDGVGVLAKSLRLLAHFAMSVAARKHLVLCVCYPNT